MDQRCEENFDRKSRDGLNLAFLDTLEILQNSEPQEEGRRNARKRARLSTAEALVPGPELAGPELDGTRITVWPPPAPPAATVTGGSPMLGQAPSTPCDPSFPVIEGQLRFSPDGNQHDAYQLDEEYFSWNFLAEM